MYGSFSFNGRSSESFDLMIVKFNSKTLNDYSAGTQTDFETESNYDGSKWYSISNKYKEPLKFEIQLSKNLCNKSNEDMYFTRDEVRAITSWLCSPCDYKPFSVNDEFYYGMNFQAKFINPQYLTVGNQICGLELIIMFERPYALSDDIKNSKTFTNTGDMIVFNHSDEFNKCLYPQKITITALSDGNIIIHNDNENQYIYTEFKDCKSGEVITMNCEDRIISSTNTSPHIMERFNKNWIRLSHGKNIFTITGNCNVEFQYKEIRRIGVW